MEPGANPTTTATAFTLTALALWKIKKKFVVL
jgi:hypothetical protein